MNRGACGSVLLLLAVGAVGPVPAEAPDCTGISNVHNAGPDLAGELTTVRVASGLSSPVFVTHALGDNDRLFIVEQAGKIKVLKNGVVLGAPFLDVDPLTTGGGERGLLGLAFHPDYQQNGYFFVYYTANDGSVTIARYQRLNADQGNPASATIVKSIPHPISNHNGGTLAFSPIDGHLYFAVGDGGSSCDPGGGVGNAQNLASDLGKLHRLDVDSLPASTSGNPFDGVVAGNDSIWSYGLRNPYRFSFDRVTGAIYIGDVGQGVWEEVDCSPGTSVGGENYGWVNMEGDHCPNASCGVQNPCPPAAYVPPIREYNQAGLPCSVIGGNVYRGCRMQALQGTYFYSDVCDDFVKTLRTNAACQVTSSPPDLNRESDLEPGGAVAIDSIVAFGEDERGELYIVDWGATYGDGPNCATPPCGEVYKVIPNLSIVEVSGPNATPLTMGTAWSWEDLPALSGIPVAFYRVVRSIGDPQGPFTCIHRQASGSAAWVGGDVTLPASGEVLYYLVIAESPTGEFSHPGTWTDGTARDVDHGAPCPF